MFICHVGYTVKGIIIKNLQRTSAALRETGCELRMAETRGLACSLFVTTTTKCEC